MESVTFINNSGARMDFEEHSRNGNYILDIRGAGIPDLDVRTYSGIEQDGASLYNVLYKPRHLTFNLGFEADDRTQLYAKKHELYNVIGSEENNEQINILINGEDGNPYWCSGVFERGAQGYTRDRTGNIEKLTVQFNVLNPFFRTESVEYPLQNSVLVDKAQTIGGLNFPIQFPLFFSRAAQTPNFRALWSRDIQINYRGSVFSDISLDIYGSLFSTLDRSNPRPCFSVENITTGGSLFLLGGAEVPNETILRLYREGAQLRLGFFRQESTWQRGDPYSEKFFEHEGLMNAWSRIDLAESNLKAFYLQPGVNVMRLTAYENTVTNSNSRVDITYHTRWLGI